MEGRHRIHVPSESLHRYVRHKCRNWRHIPEQSCGCPWGVAVGWAAEPPEVEPGAVAVETGREVGYGWTGKLQVEDTHQD